jgi:hypothetical protein
VKKLGGSWFEAILGKNLVVPILINKPGMVYYDLTWEAIGG